MRVGHPGAFINGVETTILVFDENNDLSQYTTASINFSIEGTAPDVWQVPREKLIHIRAKCNDETSPVRALLIKFTPTHKFEKKSWLRALLECVTRYFIGGNRLGSPRHGGSGTVTGTLNKGGSLTLMSGDEFKVNAEVTIYSPAL